MNGFALSVEKYTSFKFLSVLGKGSFGSVYLVENPRMGDSKLALKIMEKAQYIQRKHVSKALREKEILSQVSHNHIIRLIDAFQTPRYLCLLMEYIDSVDLWTIQHILRRSSKARLTLKEGKTIAAQIFHALDYLHGMRVIYRDLKTENIVVTRRGVIKLIDFGFAKKLDETGRTATLCGTPEYLAPEIINHLPYTYAVDWWSYGVLVYELIAGYTPFSKQGQNFNDSFDVMKQYEFILKGNLVFLDIMEEDLKDLVKALLCKDPTDRLGHTAGGPANIISHRWFRGIDVKNTETINLNFPFESKEGVVRGPPPDFTASANNDYNTYFTNYTICMV